MARHPIMNRREPRTLRVPDLMGGINMRDSLSMINDNQLTDSLNMWWQDGVLKTRPGVQEIGRVETVGYDEIIKPKQTDVFIGQYRLFFYNIHGARRSEEHDDITKTFGETGFWLQGENEIIQLPTLENRSVNFVCQKGNTVYAFIGNGRNEIWKLEFSLKNVKPEVVGEWVEVSEEEYYVPVVLTKCKTNGDISAETEDVVSSGTQFEGYNLLGSYYKMQYDALNPELIKGAFKSHPMWYFLPNSVYGEQYYGKTVTVKITFQNESGIEVAEHKVTLEGAPSTGWVREADYNEKDGLKMSVFNNNIVFSFNDTTVGNKTKFIDESSEFNCGENNIEIIAPFLPTNEEKAKIFDMTECVWFGGDAAGISGGSRLFLCGNSNESEKALVCWSGLNNPLYFSENAYAYVGNTSQAVTCFGKQADSLVIFKENGAGIFYTQYVRNDSITAENLINQTVVDYSASNVYFPIITLHPNIGCDCPDTVQLCRNRLVWACSDGNVYTISSQNQYSERNIYCVSEMINRKLKAELNLKDAFSADWEGHYLLFVQNNVYVMDYESYGYIYIASHTKSENAQTKIPWWYWEMGDGEYDVDRVIAVISLREQIYVIYYPEEPNGLISNFYIKRLSNEIDTDDGETIYSSFTTKLFDFGLPAYRKNVQLVNLSLGNNGGKPIRVELVTEYGTEEQEIILEGDETESRTAGYITNRAVHPCIKGVKRFGVKLSCEGNMAADGLSFNYIVLGGTR